MAVETLRLAEALGDPRALAAAHLAIARTDSGSRKEAHLEQALRASTATEDAVMASVVLVNQSHFLLAAARYREACVVSREAVRLAELCSPTGRLSAALHNLGEALTLVGEYDEAKWLLQRAVAHCRRLGPARCAMGLLGIADIHRHLGHDEQGRATLPRSGEPGPRFERAPDARPRAGRLGPAWRLGLRPTTLAPRRRRPSGSPRPR